MNAPWENILTHCVNVISMQVEKFEHSVTSLDRSGAKPIISPTRYFRSFSEPTLLACKKTLQKFSCFFVFILQHKNCTTINPIMIWLLAREIHTWLKPIVSTARKLLWQNSLCFVKQSICWHGLVGYKGQAISKAYYGVLNFTNK